jgi:Leucine-rich repeat (LRR) protein
MAGDTAYAIAKHKIATCLRNGATKLDLSYKDYAFFRNVGPLTAIPESLAQLTQLKSLVLSGNQLSALPEFIGQLKELRLLILSGNQLTGLPEFIEQLTELRSLVLSGNQLTVLPGFLRQFTQLKTLALSGNRLTMAPQFLGQLTQLRSLDLSFNELAALPDSLPFQLTQLQSLDLSGNQLETLPEALEQLTEMQSLRVARNSLRAIPESLGQIAQLQSLDLSFNQLTTLPESLGQLMHLELLDITNNKLMTLPSSLGLLTQLKSLDLPNNQLTELPKSIGLLTHLQLLDVTNNKLTALPESLGQLTKLELLDVPDNKLTALPKSLNHLTSLEFLDISRNPLTALPEIRNLKSLKRLTAVDSGLHFLPDWLGELEQLESLDLQRNWISTLPASISKLPRLKTLDLAKEKLNPEIAAVYQEGINAVKRYLHAQAEAHLVLNEAKLILIGEGEVGKSCLLGALRGDPWEEGKSSTHGIEIKQVKVTDPVRGTEITLNGWDFGGQRVYRPTHQLFFSAPAVYLVVWKPREGIQQGFIKDWIRLVKHREPDAKVLVVATHGGPKERQPDIDRQDIWDLFGKETVVDFFFVESRPSDWNAETEAWMVEGAGIHDLRSAIARVAASLPEVGRTVPKRWEETRKALQESNATYLPLDKALKVCADHMMDAEESKDFIRVSHRLGHLIHYAHDAALQNIVILKPDWLSTAMSYVLDDRQTRESHGLVEYARLCELWNDPARPDESRYDASLHPLFLRLMERFDLSYKVAVPGESQNALEFWQRIGEAIVTDRKPPEDLRYTSLVAQLVPDLRPKEEQLAIAWPTHLHNGDCQQMQICRIVETKNGQSANAEGLFYQLIVRLHKYSLGRIDYKHSMQWQRGLVLDDDYNGRALLEHTGNDIRITVRAAYPQAFLAILTREVKYLVESFWAGLSCYIMVPCVAPCGNDSPGTGLFEVQRLIKDRQRQRLEFPCPVCNDWQDIDRLLRNAPIARPLSLEALLTEFATVRRELTGACQQLVDSHSEAMGRFDRLDIATQRTLSRVDEAYNGLMQSLTDEAKDGPRLFSFQPIESGFFDRPNWISEKFRLTLWCEHSRLPLPKLIGQDSKVGEYELNLTRDWFEKAAPFLKVLTGTLSLVLPVAASATKLLADEASYKGLEKELDLGQKSLDSVLKVADKSFVWLEHNDALDMERSKAIRAQGAVLRQLHAWLKEQDPGFAGLVRVQNKQQEFLWVHLQFASEY